MHPASPLGLLGSCSPTPPHQQWGPCAHASTPYRLDPLHLPPTPGICLPTLGSVLRLQLHFNPVSVATPAHWAMSQGTLLQQCLLLPVLPLSWLLL